MRNNSKICLFRLIVIALFLSGFSLLAEIYDIGTATVEQDKAEIAKWPYIADKIADKWKQRGYPKIAGSI